MDTSQSSCIFLIRKALLLSLRYIDLRLVLNVVNTASSINVQTGAIGFTFNSSLTSFINCQVMYQVLGIYNQRKTGSCTQVIILDLKSIPQTMPNSSQPQPKCILTTGQGLRERRVVTDSMQHITAAENLKQSNA